MEEEWLAAFEELVGELTRLPGELIAKLGDFDRNLQFASQFLPVLGDMVKDLIEQAKALLDTFLTEVRHVIEHHAPFVSLVVQTFNWLNNVKQPVSTLAATAESSTGNENLVKWKGDAWTTYDGKRDVQVTALRAVSERADFVRTWLLDILQANIAYTTKVVRQLVTLVTEIAPIVGKAANPATAALAAAEVKDLIVTVVEHRVEEYADIAERLGEAARLGTEVVSKLSDHETFPGGAWPHAVV